MNILTKLLTCSHVIRYFHFSLLAFNSTLPPKKICNFGANLESKESKSVKKKFENQSKNYQKIHC